MLRATTACTFSTSQLPKVVRSSSVLSILTWKCASRHNGVHFFMSHLASWLRTRRFSEPTFRPSGATNRWKKHSVSRLFYHLFTHLHLLSSDLFSSDSSHLCFSTVHIVGSFTSKLPSTITTSLHCTALHYNYSYSTLHDTSLDYTTLYHTAVHNTTVHYIALHQLHHMTPYYTIPVVPARGGAEVALKIYIRPFSSIELACAVRQPSPCALCESGVLLHMSHLKLHFALHTSHCSLHTPHYTLHSSHCTLGSQHFTLHTSQSTLHTSHFQHFYTAAKKKAKRPQPQPLHRRGTFHRRPQPLYTEKHKVSRSGFLPKQSPCNIMQPLQCGSQQQLANLHLSTHRTTPEHQMTTVMQPFQCDLQAQIPKHPITTHTHKHTQRSLKPPLHCGKKKKTINRPQPHPLHRRGTFHRRPQPLYTEKHKVSRTGFLPKTKPMQHHAAITMRFAAATRKLAPIYA